MPKVLTQQEKNLIKKSEIIDKYSKIPYRDINFIGVDRSLTNTGYAVVRDGALIEFGSISTKLIGAERIINIAMRINKMVKRYSPVLLCMENYAFARANQAHQLGELGGVVKAFLTLKRIDWLDVSPNTVKKYCAGTGTAKKAFMVANVYKKWKIMTKNDDEADAVALSFLCYNSFKSMVAGKYTQKESDCFQTLLSLEKKKKKKSQKQKNKELSQEVDG